MKEDNNSEPLSNIIVDFNVLLKDSFENKDLND
jgi:hypothetical protein